MLNFSLQESLHFFLQVFLFGSCFIFSAQLNMISESVLGPVARIKCWRCTFLQTMGTLSFIHMFHVNELFFLEGDRGSDGFISLGETAAGEQTGSYYKLLGHVAAVFATRKLSILSDHCHNRKSKHKGTLNSPASKVCSSVQCQHLFW